MAARPTFPPTLPATVALLSFLAVLPLLMACAIAPGAQTPSAPKVSTLSGLRYPIVGTGLANCYGNTGEIPCPGPGTPFYGQDAQHPGLTAAYRDNENGTVTDKNTGLQWVKARGEKVTWDDAMAGAARCRVGGYTDWRMPTIQELYSLIDFRGGFHPEGGSVPYLDTRSFDFVYGDESKGERGIDCQDWSSTLYGATTMEGNPTAFGVNFADGRIKGYPRGTGPRGTPHRLYVRYVRGNPDYGKNDFVDHGDGTVTDRATGLVWSRADSGAGMDWEHALAWVQQKNRESYLGHSDWRLPSAKELQSLVDYTRCPAVSRSAAIAPLFQVTPLPDGDYPFFWTGTTHLDGPRERAGGAAVYIAFGRATGWMIPRGPGRGSGSYRLLDVHGAGAQRSDPKAGDPREFPHGRGPQGDVVRIENFVRLVRDARD